MSTQTPHEREVAELIVAALELEDVKVGEIDPEATLFGPEARGLGLDSIDALEIVLAISRKYGVELRAGDEANRRVFSSLRSLSGYIEAQRAPS